jgi:hypothetical protein
MRKEQTMGLQRDDFEKKVLNFEAQQDGVEERAAKSTRRLIEGLSELPLALLTEQYRDLQQMLPKVLDALQKTLQELPEVEQTAQELAFCCDLSDLVMRHAAAAAERHRGVATPTAARGRFEFD